MEDCWRGGGGGEGVRDSECCPPTNWWVNPLSLAQLEQSVFPEEKHFVFPGKNFIKYRPMRVSTI
jgi:hypothetical protein